MEKKRYYLSFLLAVVFCQIIFSMQDNIIWDFPVWIIILIMEIFLAISFHLGLLDWIIKKTNRTHFSEIILKKEGLKPYLHIIGEKHEYAESDKKYVESLVSKYDCIAHEIGDVEIEENTKIEKNKNIFKKILFIFGLLAMSLLMLLSKLFSGRKHGFFEIVKKSGKKVYGLENDDTREKDLPIAFKLIIIVIGVSLIFTFFSVINSGLNLPLPFDMHTNIWTNLLQLLFMMLTLDLSFTLVGALRLGMPTIGKNEININQSELLPSDKISNRDKRMFESILNLSKEQGEQKGIVIFMGKAHLKGVISALTREGFTKSSL